MIKFTEEEQRIINQTRTILRTFLTYEENHHVYARRYEPNKLAIGYINGDHKEKEQISTRFDLNLIDDVCYIIWISRDNKDRDQGLGRILIKIIENLAKDLGATKMRLNPSGRDTELGTRKGYYISLGFQPIQGTKEVEKRL